MPSPTPTRPASTASTASWPTCRSSPRPSAATTARRWCAERRPVRCGEGGGRQKPETRNQKPETRKQKPESRNQKAEGGTEGGGPEYRRGFWTAAERRNLGSPRRQPWE